MKTISFFILFLFTLVFVSKGLRVVTFVKQECKQIENSIGNGNEAQDVEDNELSENEEDLSNQNEVEGFIQKYYSVSFVSTLFDQIGEKSFFDSYIYFKSKSWKFNFTPPPNV